MVVRLKPDQFTAGDMIFMVRSRRRARADPRFYGENVSKIQIENKKKEEVRISQLFKESDEYFTTEPVKEIVEEQQESLEEQVRQESPDALNERARKLLTEIEEDVKQMNRVKLEKESLKRSPKKNTEFSIQNQLEFLINEVYR